MVRQQLRSRIWWLFGVAGVVAIGVAFAFRTMELPKPVETTQPKNAPVAAQEIGCAGRIQPDNGLVKIAARDPSGGTAVIERTDIHEQQHLLKGQFVATLRGRSLAEAAWKASAQRVITARLKLEQLKAAPKEAEFASKTSEMERRQIDLEHAQTELARYELLRKTEDVSASDVESRRATFEVAKRSLEQARQDRSALGESRQADAAVLLSEIRVAEAEQARLQAETEQYTIRAPTSGQVLRLLVHSGESVGPNGIAEILEDGPLYVIAEVAEADIFRVHVGSKATVKGELLPFHADGVVEKIGRAIAGSEVLTSDPSAFTDKRIVPVKIRLSGVEPSQALIYARVAVLIHP